MDFQHLSLTSFWGEVQSIEPSEDRAADLSSKPCLWLDCVWFERSLLENVKQESTVVSPQRLNVERALAKMRRTWLRATNALLCVLVQVERHQHPGS
jgi:hypothetical protein